MSWSPLIKIPWLLGAMISNQIASTPPHQPPNEDETAPSTSLETVLKLRMGPKIVRSICYLAGLAEIIVILASNFSGYPLSKVLLSSLVIGPNAIHRIRPTSLFFVGALLTICGGALRWSCYRTLGHLFTFEMSIRKDHKLVTNGPYAWVRHPGYAGILLTVAGTICWNGCSGSWTRESGVLLTVAGKAAALTNLTLTLTITSGLILRMSKEDEALGKTFGKDWDEWAVRVPYKLIPYVY